MDMLDDYLALQERIFEYFDYIEDWRVLPIVDSRGMYWKLDEDSNGGGSVSYAESAEQLRDESLGDYYRDDIYTQRHLKKWVYRGEDYTMIVVDTNTDGNQLLRIFANKDEIKT